MNTEKKKTAVKISTSKLSLANPEQVMAFGKVLEHYINTNNLSCNISGKKFAYADGWKFAMLNFGLTAVVKKPVKLSAGQIMTILFEKILIMEYGKQKDKIKAFFTSTNRELALAKEQEKKPFRKVEVDFYNYECECEVKQISTGKVIGYGYAICNNGELGKVDFDEYAIASMCQTRSIAKAAKNLIGFVMNAAGFESTPAEEMEEKYVDSKPVWDNAEADLDLSIRDCKTEEDLLLLWNSNTAYQNDKKISTKFSKRKLEIRKEASGAK